MSNNVDPYLSPPFRDEFSPAQEREMEERQAWEEQNCTCEDPGQPELVDRECLVHGDPEIINKENA